MSEATTPTGEAPAFELDDRDAEPRTPMKRLGSTRKLAAFNNIRVQLTEQTRILETRAEAAAGVAGELHDYCRRRAELEADYSRALDKLVRTAHQKHKEQRHKREQWSLTGAYACWQSALDSTKSLSKDHAALAALYGGQLASRLQRAADDALRLHRKCRDIVVERHEEVGAALAEAAAAGKAAAAAASEWRAAAAKLRHAHDQRTRLAAAEPPRPKKLKAIDKELEKRRGRHSESRARALRARADYVLSLEAANATLQRYYLDDIADIMLCMEVGFEAVVGRCVRTAAEAEAARAAALAAAAGALRGAATALDALRDRQRALDAHAPAFALPRPLPYQGTPPDQQVTDTSGALAAAAGALRGAATALDALRDRQRALDAHAPAFALPRPLPYQGTPPDQQVTDTSGALAAAAGALRGAATALDALRDRQRALDAHAPAFALPRPLPYQGTPPDQQVTDTSGALAAAAGALRGAATALDALRDRQRALDAHAPAFALPRPLPYQGTPPDQQVTDTSGALAAAAGALRGAATALDALRDRQRALDAHAPAFALPRPLPYQGTPPDQQVTDTSGALAAAAGALRGAATALDALRDRQRALDAHAPAFALPRPLPYQGTPPDQQVTDTSGALAAAAGALRGAATALDALRDRQRALDAHAPAFALPRPLPYQGTPPDQQVTDTSGALAAAAGALRGAATALDALRDRQRALDAHAPAFALPRPLPYQGTPPDQQVTDTSGALAAAAGALRGAATALDALRDRQRALDAHAPAFALPRPLPYQGTPPDQQVTDTSGALAAAAGALRGAATALDALRDRQRALDAHAPAFALPRPLPYQGTPPDQQVTDTSGALAAAAGALRGAATALDALRDRQRALDAHAPAFALPRPLPYQGTPPDQQDQEMLELVNGAAEEQDAATAGVASELAARLQQLESGARALRAECQESAKTLDAAEAELVRQMEGSPAQWDTSKLFGVGAVPPTPVPEDPEGPRKEQEDYYLAKFRSYVASAGRLARLESKATALRARGEGGGTAPASPPSPPRRAAARLRRGQFAAPLPDHAHAELPRVLTSCVRVISTYGLRHQGIFRVSGSQVEMQALRAAFERGEDPLAHVRDASDINSVCGLLKLYLRELRPPLLPPQLQERLLRLAALPADAEFVRRMRELLAALPPASVLVLRYLLAFLAHLTEYSEHNMMDAWNLAICVGPTLLAAWGEGGAQLTAQNLVNELVKRTIIHHAAIFPQDLAPHARYVRPSEEDENAEEASSVGGEDNVDAADEPDVNDDLSLYDDDDDNDDDDEISDEGENGDWRDRDSVERRSGSLPRRPSAPAAQVREPSPAAPAASTSAAQCRRLAEATPDLVLDLPARAAAERDAADTFAHNQDTLKKRTSKPSSSDSAAAAEPAPEAEARAEPEPGASAACEGSPVPARNTARVAAKFAELTLTGGSLKPALAAKPALLRRPTPHPQHARPPPPDDA